MPLQTPVFAGESSPVRTQNSPRPSKRARRSDSASPSNRCQVCSRTFERADHLHRHLDSHRNRRPFRCDECPAAFNRRDLLLRHQAAHAKIAVDGRVGAIRPAQRATKACDGCVLSKVKCDNSRPCQKRCRKREVVCMNSSASQSHALTTPPNSSIQQIPGFPATSEQAATTQPLYENVADSSLPLQKSSDIYPVPTFSEVDPDTQALLDLNNSSYSHGQIVPSFFEHIMVQEPDFMGPGIVQSMPRIATWIPDVDWTENFDLFSIDFMPTVDESLHVPWQSPAVEGSALHADETPGADTTTQGSAIDQETCGNRKPRPLFERSPSSLISNKQHRQPAFSEQDSITLDERNIDMASSPHHPYAASLTMQDRLSPQSRDRIFRLVLQTAKSQISIPSFPSADCLDKLIKVGIAKRTETDAWIHPYTFDSEHCRSELLTALVAAGCVCFGIPSVSRTGLVLQEIVRAALNRLTEEDRSIVHDLQYLQASMLWLDIGSFCGFRRIMDIAESNLQPLVTALRRAGKFDRTAYTMISPAENDNDDEIERKWRSWAEQESYQRLVYHVFEHDIDMTMTRNRSPIISYSEVTLPIPASRLLWLAPSAAAWKAAYFRLHYQPPSEIRPTSLRSLLVDDSGLQCLPSSIDAEIARSSHLHGIAAQIWEYRQQTNLSNEHLDPDPSSMLWLQARNQRLNQMLGKSTLTESSAIASLFQYFLQMHLYVDLDCIIRFAGKCGEEEAHRAYIVLSSWSQKKEARSAIRCAGQALRAARTIPPYQLRGTDSFIIYYAVMVLWAWGMLQCDWAKRTATTTPTCSGMHPGIALHRSNSDQLENIFLDAPCSKENDIDTFIRTGKKRPCLRLSSHVASEETTSSQEPDTVDLKCPSKVMAVGTAVLQGNYPHKNASKADQPPLVKSLCELMHELGNVR